MSRTPSRYREWLKTSVNTMKNLKAQYNLSSVQGKQYLLGSIFPENIEISSLVEQRGGKSKHFEGDLTNTRQLSELFLISSYPLI